MIGSESDYVYSIPPQTAQNEHRGQLSGGAVLAKNGKETPPGLPTGRANGCEKTPLSIQRGRTETQFPVAAEMPYRFPRV